MPQLAPFPPAPRVPGPPDVAPAAPPPALLLTPAPPDLAPLVEYVWQLALPRAPGAVWRVVADGYLDLSVVVPLGPDLLATAAAARRGVAGAARALAEALSVARRVVCGAATASRTVAMDVPQLLTGVRFRLGTAAAVLRSTPGDLVDGARPLGDVVGGHTAEHAAVALGAGASGASGAPAAAGAGAPAGPHAALAAARAAADDEDGEAVIRAVARAGVEGMARQLVARAAARAGARAADPRVRGALHLLDRDARAGAADVEDGGARVAAAARALAVSPRTLERLFADHVGYAPRTYQRLRRVGAVARALEHAGAAAGASTRASTRAPAGAAAGAAWRPAPARRGPAGTLSGLAHDLGYTDHAHMTREFTRVMGLSPSRYRREASAAPVEVVAGAVAPERATPVGTVGAAGPGA